ncbi:RNA-directed DNA polymerase, eukaryota [Tanacetum coccineum]
MGKLVMMGDFNEVRYKSDRYGSNFNAHDAEIFNSFIYNAGLDEVPLGGSAYYWCSNCSKRVNWDRFFVSENLWRHVSYITAILRGVISDHRPILYVMILGTWLLLTRKMPSETSWVNLNFLKTVFGAGSLFIGRIREVRSISLKRSCGLVMRLLIREIARMRQSEGDENVKFFHGMLNKKRNQSNIRGIMVNGTWVDDPVQVKREFFEHFRGRFDKPSVNRACIDTPFPVSLSIDQKEDMERRILKWWLKSVVWDCGVVKSQGQMVFHFSFNFIFGRIVKDVLRGC